MHWNLLDAEVLNWRYSTMPPAQFYGELFEIRLMIEPQAAALAASRGDRRGDRRHRRSLRRDDRGRARRDASAVDADLRFHRAILAAGHNALLLQMGNLIAVGLYIAHKISAESFTVFLPMHKLVLDAIRARDPVKARQAMEHLLSETLAFMSTGT